MLMPLIERILQTGLYYAHEADISFHLNHRFIRQFDRSLPRSIAVLFFRIWNRFLFALVKNTPSKRVMKDKLKTTCILAII